MDRKIRRSGRWICPSDLLIVLFLLPSSCGGPLSLPAPNVSPMLAREPTRVDLDPIETRGAVVLGDYAAPGPAAVLTAAMGQELAGRGLTGGERGGYSVRCSLGRFAMRTQTTPLEGVEMLALYADLSCEAKRAEDGAPVWRGELRGRAVASAGNLLGSDPGTTGRLLARALSDASREMATDLAVRGLGLLAAPSVRVFTDEGQQKAASGLDDTPWGAAALQQNADAGRRALASLDPHDAALRAAAWNVVAMAAGPGDPWVAGDTIALDPEPLVRFVQYKALARHGSEAALAQLRAASGKEGDSLLAELAKDALASGGIGVARSKR
jgi:hypothetical protein